MAATNIFYRIPAQRGTRVASIAGTECTLDQFCNHIFNTEGLNRRDFIIASGTKVFRPSSCNLQLISLQNNSTVDILIPLLGGKGGFGSLLRAIGAQIEKTTNRDACRDLSGRRLRDIKREDELKKLLELQATLEAERKRRRREKLEKLKKKSENPKSSASIQELVAMFDDHAFNQRRLELGDIIDAAVEKGLINSKKRQMSQVEGESSKKVRLGFQASPKTSIEPTPANKVSSIKLDLRSCKESETSLVAHPRTPAQINNKSTKKQDLWLGLDEDLDQVSDEGQDDAETETAQAVVV